jgi:MFS family permease
LSPGKRNVFLLACCQALLLTNAVTLIAIGALAGYQLAPTKALATLPPFSYVLGAAIASIPASFWMKRVGRRAGFLTGGAIGLAGSMLATVAMAIGSFALLCAGSMLLGVYNAFGQYYRFAAADAAPPDFKAKAISYVLAGGLVGGIVGPELSKLTADMAEPRFMVSYASLSLYCLVAMGITALLAFPAPKAEESAQAPTRPMGEIVRQPAFIVAAACAGLGYGVMTLLMTATPLAMGFCGHPYGAAAGVIAAHVVAMFAPSFFTGSLIQRFGVLPVIAAGVAIEIACVLVALSGEAVAHFWWALVLLGLGWNFTYVGGTTLLTETYRPAEKAKVQGLNEFIVFGVQALASLSSGVLVNAAGWNILNAAALPMLALAGGAALWLMAQRRAATPS